MTYIFILFTVAICWRCSLRLGLIALTASTVAGLVLQRIQPLGLLWILLAGFSIWSATNPSLSKWLRWTSMSIFLLMSIALSGHVLPGFNNFLAFDRVQFSPDSARFTMYLISTKRLSESSFFYFFSKQMNLILGGKKTRL